jgi:surfeit locus 1 family protein
LIKIRLGRGYFTPRLWPTLLTLLMLPILLWLGTWQVHRLHWKRELMATISERVHDAPLEVPYVGLSTADYRPATANGVFHHDVSQFVFSTDLVTGKGGYHVLTPLQLSDGQYLLVDRGWVPYEQKQEKSFFRPEGTTKAHGILRLPTNPSWMMPHNDPSSGNWYSIDLTAMAAADKLPSFLPYVLEADGSANPGGLPVGGQTRLTLPNDHFSYAVTWYGFAIILLIIYGLSSWRNNDKTTQY